MIRDLMSPEDSDLTVVENIGDSFVEERLSTAIERGEFPVFRYEPAKMDMACCVPREGSCWLEKKLLPILDEYGCRGCVHCVLVNMSIPPPPVLLRGVTHAYRKWTFGLVC